MAADTPETEAPGAPTEGGSAQPCSPCRGTGKVISNLGGSPSTVDCPWCDGTGTFIPEHDAQAHHGGVDQTSAPEA